jgi:hypothetical protein
MSKKRTLEDLKKESLKYKTRYEFQKNSPAYQAASKRKILDQICSHMSIVYRDWTYESMREEALKYSTRTEFAKNSPAYQVAIKRKVIDQICSHMTFKYKYWDFDKIRMEALKYKTRYEFQKNSAGAYQSAYNTNCLDSVCSHMTLATSSSDPEKQLLNLMKNSHPKIQKLVERRINVPGKSHIKGFDIDIYDPELKKGIEFDGTYWHSIEGLKRSRQDWPQEDLENYHQIKDDYFKSKGIELLHINEKDWKENKEKCIKKCLDFLKNSNLLSL